VGGIASQTLRRHDGKSWEGFRGWKRANDLCAEKRKGRAKGDWGVGGGEWRSFCVQKRMLGAAAGAGGRCACSSATGHSWEGRIDFAMAAVWRRRDKASFDKRAAGTRRSRRHSRRPEKDYGMVVARCVGELAANTSPNFMQPYLLSPLFYEERKKGRERKKEILSEYFCTLP